MDTSKRTKHTYIVVPVKGTDTEVKVAYKAGKLYNILKASYGEIVSFEKLGQLLESSKSSLKVLKGSLSDALQNTDYTINTTRREGYALLPK